MRWHKPRPVPDLVGEMGNYHERRRRIAELTARGTIERRFGLSAHFLHNISIATTVNLRIRLNWRELSIKHASRGQSLTSRYCK